jgi:hypothetical protein
VDRSGSRCMGVYGGCIGMGEVVAGPTRVVGVEAEEEAEMRGQG